ncbi:MAG: KH domain-containing protein [Acidimicrobiales bacterium]|nr:Jag N-terminal domain-containing protein [Acidimicrobiia bacterium]NNC79231.1 KH domain-containing protein [Acidimicrobiales bacterium]
MDWITTSGRTLDEAKSNALDQLGIVADEAEFDIVNDVEKGLFGRIKTDAKVRTRVRPKQPASTDTGRRRGGKGQGKGGGNRNRGRGNGGGSQSGGGQGGGGGGNRGGKGRGGKGGGQQQRQDNRGNKSEGSKPGGRSQRDQRQGGGKGNQNQQSESNTQSSKSADDRTQVQSQQPKQTKKETVDTQMDRAEQEQVAVDFLHGVLNAFDMEGSAVVSGEEAEDNAIEIDVTGTELGLLVGPKGNTLNALQELTRTVVQREADGAKTDRLRVDVSGYRARRAEALGKFATQIAEDVLESGSEKVLEPMGPADRKIVHDTINDIDGVDTGSEGEEPRRRVVIRPA